MPTPIPSGGVTSARGFRAGAASAGVKDGPPRLDLAVVVGDHPGPAHALFTQCRVVADPVIVSRQRIADSRAQGIVINSGNANACTGPDGMVAALEMADLAAAQVGIDPALMLVASTGVIGVPFPIDRVRRGIAELRPTATGGHDAAQAIMTTDLVPKEYAVRLDLGGQAVAIGGMAKGSGMIHPNLATMLAVVTTDASLDADVARSTLQAAADRSFNQVSVDRDTSTNDMLLLLSSGASGAPLIQAGTPEGAAFAGGLEAVCVALARMIARDGEGASRLIEVAVDGARSDEEARRIAREVISSNLVKAAVYGCDPNWGRILCAVGNAGATIDPNIIDVEIGDCRVASAGAAVAFDADQARRALEAEEVRIRVSLHRGLGMGLAWGCDLTEGYVKINAEYTT